MSEIDRRRIMTVFEDGDYTCDQVEVITGLPHQTCSARIKDLKDDGLLVMTGYKRPTRSGREAAVYTRSERAIAEATSQGELF